MWEGKRDEFMFFSRLNNSVCIHLTPQLQTGYNTRSIFKPSTTGLNSEFSFSQTGCLTKTKEISLLYYLAIAVGRIDGLISFPKALALSETQRAACRI